MLNPNRPDHDHPDDRATTARPHAQSNCWRPIMPTSIDQGSDDRQEASRDAFPHDEAQPSTGTIDPSINARSGESSEHALPNRDDLESHADRIARSGIDQGSIDDHPAASLDAPPNDERRPSTGTIVTDLPSRSDGGAEAFPKVRLNDERAEEQNPRKAPQTNPVGCTTSAIDAFPSPAPAVSKTSENRRKSSPRRSRFSVPPTDHLHSEAVNDGLTSRGSSKIVGAAHLSTDRCVRSSIGYCTEFSAPASAGARYPLP